MRYDVAIRQVRVDEYGECAECVCGTFDTLRTATIFAETVLENFANAEVIISKVKEEETNGMAVSA